jgi:hypothetical protein
MSKAGLGLPDIEALLERLLARAAAGVHAPDSALTIAGARFMFRLKHHKGARHGG